MALFSFGEENKELGYKTLDERVMRGSAGIMLLFGVIASINGFVLKNYSVIPYISGFLMINFLIGIFINPKFSPSVILSKLFVKNQSPLPVGAIQKKFAWSLGLAMSVTIFILSFSLLKDASYFNIVCMLCMICIALLYLESVFGICVGCKLYFLGIKLKLIKEPKIRPNCTGDSCAIK